MNKTILIALTGILVFGSALTASAATNLNSSTSTIYKNVTGADLGVQAAGTLPTSNWYFLKEWRRDIQRLFILNPVAKAEFELQVTNEKAAELIEVQEGGKNDGAALQRALKNYTSAHERLKARLAEVKEDSANPNVAKLLEEVGAKTAQHTALLNQVAERWSSDPYAEDSNRKLAQADVDVITNALQNAQDKTQATVVASALKETDVKQKAAEQIKRAQEAIMQAQERMKAGLESAGGILAHDSSVVGGLVPGGAVISAAVSSVSQLGGHPTTGGGAASASYAKSATLQATGNPGGAVQNTKVDEEGTNADIAIGDPGVNGNRAINTKGTGAVAKSATLNVSASPGGTVQNTNVDDKNTAPITVKQKKWMAANFRLSQTITTATDHLARAQKAYAEGSYGEAFGLAQSAEVMAVEASRISTNMTIERQTPKRDFGDRASSEKAEVVAQPVRTSGGIKDTLQTQVIKVAPTVPEPKPRSIPENSIESKPSPTPEGGAI